MTSSHHGPYGLGYTRATMVGTKRLPCYDFTPVMNHKVVTVLPKVRLATSFATHSHGVTGGVYKARERIHRSSADLRLLAIPTSCSRVADCNPD